MGLFRSRPPGSVRHTRRWATIVTEMAPTRPFDPPVYLDYAASTPLHPAVLQEMLPYLSDVYGNASSQHSHGRAARAAVDLARDRVAALLHTQAARICFTSGGTESDNLALLGTVPGFPADRRAVVVSALEHHAVLRTAERLRTLGLEVRVIPATADGGVDLQRAQDLIDPSVAFVSLMYANNETGALLPVKRVAAMARGAGALMHTDAVQAGGIARLAPESLGVDLLSLSAHKMYGPKGVGVLWVRRGLKLAPLISGGAQERERRAGTENVPAIVGMGCAAELALQERPAWLSATIASRDAFLEGLGGLDGVCVQASGISRLPGILSLTIAGVSAELLVMRLDGMGISVSTGAACASGSAEPSHVLRAMGLSGEQVRSTIRVSFGRTSDPAACRAAGETVAWAVQEMRALAEANALG